MTWQDMLSKKESQGTKMQELQHKLTGLQQNRETLERTCYNIRDEVSHHEQGKLWVLYGLQKNIFIVKLSIYRRQLV